MKKKLLLLFIGCATLWVGLFNFPPNTPLSNNAVALFNEYHRHMQDSPVIAELIALEALVVAADPLCETSNQGCLEWLSEQSLQTSEAENAARQIINSDSFAVNQVLDIEDPILPYGALYRALQSYLSRVLKDATLWVPLVTDLQSWCEQQMELVGYIVCISSLEQALDVGDYLVLQGKLAPQSLSPITDDAMRMALIGEWVHMNTYINEDLVKETFGWKYWITPKFVRLYFLDSQAMVNASAEKFQQSLGYLQGDTTEFQTIPCNFCGKIGEILHQIAHPELRSYIDRHHDLQRRLNDFGA